MDRIGLPRPLPVAPILVRSLVVATGNLAVTAVMPALATHEYAFR